MYAIFTARIAGEDQLLKQYAGWLMRHVPVPPMAAELCLRRLVTCPDNLPNRLRGEHPGEFQPTFLAAILDRDLRGRHEEAFDALAHLASEAQSDDEKEAVSVAIFAKHAGRVRPRGSIRLLKS